MDRKIVIAVIVSNSIDHCRRFLYHHKLNPKCFRIATKQPQLHGVDPKVPIIITHSDDRNAFEYFEMMDFIQKRFTRVRYMDY